MSDFDWLTPMQVIGKEPFYWKSHDLNLFRELFGDGTVKISNGKGALVACLNTDLDIYDGASQLVLSLIEI